MLVQSGNGQYTCKCGKIIRKASVRAHVKTRYHMSRCDNAHALQQCDICYLDKVQFYTCHECRNKHCSDCHPRMTKCPFCRKIFPQVSTPRVSEHDDEFDFDADFDAWQGFINPVENYIDFNIDFDVGFFNPVPEVSEHQVQMLILSLADFFDHSELSY